MSIEEDYPKIKPLGQNRAFGGGSRATNSETIPTEEEFEIVKKGDSTSLLSTDKALILLIIALTVSLAYGIGKLRTLESGQRSVKILYPQTATASSTPNATTSSLPSSGQVRGASITNIPTSTEVVASKSGTKYHFPWCSGAKRILPENKITFPSPKEARAAGYSPAANCKGLP
jgi:hypothetical protein